jgi:predicted  nucleic acid-binding Zn-ribbon protein
MQHRSISIGNLRNRLLMLAVGGSLLCAGCEKMENTGRVADRSMDAKLADSAAAAEGFGPQAKSKSIDDVKAAAAISGLSDAGKARATSALARSEYEQALALLPQVQTQSLQVQQALWDLRAAAMEMQRIEQTAGFYQQLDPKDAIAKMDEVRGQVQGQLDKVKSDLSALKADLAKRQQEITDLTAQRQKLQTQAAGLETQSLSTKGEQGVTLFKQSADLSVKAGDLASQIDTKNAQLMPLQHQIDMAARQVQITEGDTGALPQIDSRKTQLSAAWDSSQQHAQEIKAGVKKILDEVVTPNTDKSHPNAGAQVQTLVSENDKMAGEIEKLLADAIKNAEAAAKAASAYHHDLQQEITALKPTSPEVEPLKQAMAAYDEQQYQLLKGNAQLALANFYAGRALVAADRKRTLDSLGSALKASDLQLPADLTAVDPDPIHADADKTFAAAEDTLQKVSVSTSNAEGFRPIRVGGLGSLIWARWGHLQLTADATEKSALQQDLDRAKENQLEIPASLHNMQ